MDNKGQRDDFYFQKEKRFQNSSKEIEIKKVSFTQTEVHGENRDLYRLKLL